MESPNISACAYAIPYIACPLLPQNDAIKIMYQIFHSIILIVINLKPKTSTNKLAHRHIYVPLPLYGVVGCPGVLQCVHS